LEVPVNSVKDFFETTRPIDIAILLYPLLGLQKKDKYNVREYSKKISIRASIIKILVLYVVILFSLASADDKLGREFSFGNLHYFAAFVLVALFVLYFYINRQLGNKKDNDE
jgi:low temperature requirement protein LtrA